MDRLKELLRSANIAVSAVAILCLVFLFPFVFHIPPTLVVVVLVLLFSGFLAFETKTSGSVARHALVSALIVWTAVVGYFYTTSVSYSFLPRPRKPAKQTEWTIPQTETGGLASRPFRVG